MSIVTDTLFNADFLKIAIPATGAILAWYFNERSKVRSEQLQRKEERYKELLRCLKGFYVGKQNAELKSQFIDQVNLCWLYAPDDAVRKAYAFFSTIHAERATPATDDEKQRALAEFVVAIRNDMLGRKLISRTTLQPADWKSFHA